MFNPKLSISGYLVFFLTGMAFNPTPIVALADGLALTPPMGWSSWNWFGCTGTSEGRKSRFPGNQNGIGISESIVIGIADSMISTGMKDAGFQYINIDDCYLQHDRSPTGGLLPNPKTFPNGIKAVADSIHKRGLKFGIYTTVFDYSCADIYDSLGAGQPGMYGYEEQDSDSFVVWGVDYVKVDYCGSKAVLPPINFSFSQKREFATNRYSKVSNALRGAVRKARAKGQPARDMVISICEYGHHSPFFWADTLGHLWRTENDILPTKGHILTQVNAMLSLWSYHGPGHWNDPDMLQVGNGMSESLDRTHFSLWSILAAPLIAGNDLRKMAPATKNLFVNQEVVAVNQDSLGLQGRKIKEVGTNLMVISKKLRDGSYAILFVNDQLVAVPFSVTWKAIGQVDPLGIGLDSLTEMRGRDLLGQVDIPGIFTKRFAKTVPAEDVYFFKLTPASHSSSLNKKGKLKSESIDFSTQVGPMGIKIHTLKTLGNSPAQYALVDLNGVVLHKTNGPGTRDWTIPLGKISSGSYFILMKSGIHTLKKMVWIP